MAEKKYIDLTGLSHYDEKIKAVIDSKDAAALKSAKDYADSLAGNYDAAGTAETKVNELANGQVKDNTAAITKLNGDAKTEGSVAKAVADAQAGLDSKISAADAKAAGAQSTADAAKAAAAAVDAKIGEVPEGSTVIAEIQKVKDAAYDDTEVRGLIKTNADDIDNLEGRADAVEGKVTTLVGDDAGKSARTIANEELTKQLIPENAKDSLDTLQEIAQWIQKHPDDAAAMNAAIAALQTKVGDIPDGATATTIVGYIQELVNAEKTRATGVEDGIKKDVTALQTAIGEGGSVADQISTAVAAEAALRDAADKTLDGKVATAQAAAEAAQKDVDGLKTSKADQTALDTVAGRVTTVEGKVKTLEGYSHTHANADVLDAITAGNVAGWDSAHAKEHEHANKAVLDAISEAKVSAWDAAEQNAKAYTDGKIAEFTPITTTEIDALFGVSQA